MLRRTVNLILGKKIEIVKLIMHQNTKAKRRDNYSKEMQLCISIKGRRRAIYTKVAFPRL